MNWKSITLISLTVTVAIVGVQLHFGYLSLLSALAAFGAAFAAACLLGFVAGIGKKPS